MSDHPPARRGRGRCRPPALTGPRRQDLLDHLADGLTIQQAATATGIARATVYNTRAHDPAASDAITTALAAGKARRAAARHGTEGCYTRHGCRRPECTAAATAARTTRRAADTSTGTTATVLPAPVTAAALPAPTGRTTLVLLDLHTTAPPRPGRLTRRAHHERPAMLPFRLAPAEPTSATLAPEPVPAPAPGPVDLTLVLARVGTGTSTAADADTILDALTALQRQVNAARAFADEMTGYCSPHNLAATYAQRLTDRLDAAGNLQPAHHS